MAKKKSAIGLKCSIEDAVKHSARIVCEMCTGPADEPCHQCLSAAKTLTWTFIERMAHAHASASMEELSLTVRRSLLDS